MAGNSQKLVLTLTVSYFFIELTGGLYYHSLALVTDASFMATNVTGQILAYYMGKLALRLPDEHNTFGYERAKVLSGLFTGMLAGFVFFYVLIDAYRKITHPMPLDVEKILYIAVLGLVVNVYGLFALYKHSKDMAIKGALVLVLNDALGSVGVIASAVIIRYTHLYIIDPLTGVLLGLIVVYPTYALIKEGIRILMESNPGAIGTAEVTDLIRGKFNAVSSVKDVRIWGLSTEKIMLAARIRTNAAVNQRETARSIKRLLRERFGFYDTYIELYETKGVEEHAAYEISQRVE